MSDEVKDDEEQEVKCKETDIVDLAKVEVTKATISQAIGTLIYPLTSELAAAQVHGINKFKEYMKSRGKQKLAEKNKENIEVIITKAEKNPEKLRAIEKVHKVIELASEKELENDDVLELWSAIIRQIEEGDSDVDFLIEKLESLSTAEAEFLLRFKSGEHPGINVNPFLSAIAFTPTKNTDYERDKELAYLLKEKGLLIQPFPVLRAIFLALFPILFFLLFAELYREQFLQIDINVSSANNVILMGVAGVILGLSTLPFLKQRTRLTWISEKICKGVNVKMNNNK